MLNKLQDGAASVIQSVINNDSFKDNLQPQAQKAYVQLMMEIISRGLVAASENDEVINEEVKGFPVGTTIQMLVMPNVAQFTLKVQSNGTFKVIKPLEKPDLSIKFKHVTLAFLVFSFQESTATAFARDRMIADGDICHAIRMVRCLNRLEAVILPKMIAQLAIKKYPENLSLKEKLSVGAKVYTGLAKSFVTK